MKINETEREGVPKNAVTCRFFLCNATLYKFCIISFYLISCILLFLLDFRSPEILYNLKLSDCHSLQSPMFCVLSKYRFTLLLYKFNVKAFGTRSLVKSVYITLDLYKISIFVAYIYCIVLAILGKFHK